MLRWWSWILCLAVALSAPCGVRAGDDDEEESVIEVDSGADPGDEPEKRPKPGATQPRAARPKRQPGEKHPLVLHRDKDGVHRIRLPDDWVVSEAYERDSVLAYELLLPGAETRATLHVMERADVGDPRSAPVRWREGTRKQSEFSRAEIAHDKVPRLLLYYDGEGRNQVTAMGFRRIAGHGFVVRLVCTQSDFEDAHADFASAAASFEADLEPALPIPKDYSVKKKGRWCFAVHPAVKNSLRYTQKVIASQEKRFTKFHGPLPKPDKDEPTVVFVHLDRSQASRVLEAAANAQTNHYTDAVNARLFTTAINKNDTEQAGLLAAEAQGLLYVLRYGQPAPLWVYAGERNVARGEEVTGKRLPYLHEGMLNWRTETSLGSLAELPGLRESNGDSFWRQAFFYVCFFQAGDSRYRSAYRAFLDELATTFDADAALARHIEPLGYDQIRADAREFMNFKLIAFRPK